MRTAPQSVSCVCVCECVACVASVWRVRKVTPFPLPHNIERSPQMRGNVNRYLKMLGSTTQGHAAQSQNGRPKITHEFLEIAFSGSHFYWVTFSMTRAIENSHTRGRTTQCVLVMMYARIILNPMAPFGVCYSPSSHIPQQPIQYYFEPWPNV